MISVDGLAVEFGGTALFSELNSTCKCNRILINNLFKFFVWREVSKSFTRSIIEFLSSTYKCNFLGADNKQ